MAAYLDDAEMWANGARLTYRRAGARGAAAICFIPGWCCDRSFWDAQVDYFASRYFVLAMDFPGSGNSPLPEGNLKNASQSAALMSGMAVQVAELIARENLSECCLVGHSAGGALALTVAADHLGKSSSVVGVDAFTNLQFYPRQEAHVVDAILAPLEAEFPSAVRGIAETWFLESADPALKGRIIDALASADQTTATAILRSFLHWDLTAYLEKFPGAVGAIVADAFYDARAVQTALGDRMQIQSIADVGHFLMLEQPQQFNAALETFLRSR